MLTDDSGAVTGGDHGAVGAVLSGALGAHPRRRGAGVVSARVYRLLFWLGLFSLSPSSRWGCCRAS